MIEYVLCYDVGGTEIKYNVMDKNGNLVGKTSNEPTPKTKAEFVNFIECLIANSPYKINGLAASMPGFINSEKGYLERGGAILYFDETDFFATFAHLNIPMSVDNDARCVAMAEFGDGAAKGCENFACLTIGTGIGVGLMVNGKLVEGKHSRAGEFGHNIVKRSDGQSYNYHQTASMKALIEMYCDLKQLPLDAEVTGKDIFAAAETDSTVKALLAEWYRNLAIAIFNLTTTFDFEKILIGGGVSARPELIDNIVAAITDIDAAAVWPIFNIPVEACKYRNEAGLIGAFYRFKASHSKLF